MSYTPVSGQIYSPQLQQPPHHFYSATPPPPPPKPSGSSTPARGPPLPPPPPGAPQQNGPSELDGNQGQGAQQQSSLPPIPTIDSTWLPETLKEKNTTDLHALLQDPALQSALLDAPETQHPAVPASHQALRPLIESNLQLATSLLELETRLAQQREAVQSRLLALRALEQQHRTKLAETEDALSGFSPMALYQRLSGSVQEQDQLLQSLEESWLDEGGVASERELTDFVRRVREGRKVGFLRRERKERWDEGRVGGWR